MGALIPIIGTVLSGLAAYFAQRSREKSPAELDREDAQAASESAEEFEYDMHAEPAESPLKHELEDYAATKISAAQLWESIREWYAKARSEAAARGTDAAAAFDDRDERLRAFIRGETNRGIRVSSAIGAAVAFAAGYFASFIPR